MSIREKDLSAAEIAAALRGQTTTTVAWKPPYLEIRTWLPDGSHVKNSIILRDRDSCDTVTEMVAMEIPTDIILSTEEMEAVGVHDNCVTPGFTFFRKREDKDIWVAISVNMNSGTEISLADVLQVLQDRKNDAI